MKIPVGKIWKFIKANPWAAQLIKELGIFAAGQLRRLRKQKKKQDGTS